MASFFLFQSILAPFVSFKAFPLLSVIALKILTISYFFYILPGLPNCILIDWLCQCLTISVILIKFLENLVCLIPYLIDWNRILSVFCAKLPIVTGVRHILK